MANQLTDPESFQKWKEHPLTAEFRRFLKDRVQAAAMLWASERASSAEMQADQTRAGTWLDLADLTNAEVRAFYELDEVENAE